MKTLYLISGKAGSGKDFLGNIFQKHGYIRFAFADHLKDLTAIKYNISRFDLNTQQGKKNMYGDKTYRDLLIENSVFLKKNDKFFFAKSVIDNFKKWSFNQKGVVTDFRFPEEYEYAKKELGNSCILKTILVKRNNYIEIDDESEKALADFNFDYIVDNNFCSDYLLSQIKDLI